jgi:hypothetical protein
VNRARRFATARHRFSNPRSLGPYAALAVAGVLLAWLLFVALPRWHGGDSSGMTDTAHGSPVETRRITASLFYVAEDSARLAPVQREVVFGESTLEQARRILEAQLQPAPAGMALAVPPETTLRGLYVTDGGDAFVDLSGAAAANHTGGTMNEILTVYTIVHALTANLPAVSRVQILLDGREVDTLAGHVDLRRPLPPGPEWVDDGKRERETAVSEGVQ